MIETDLVDLPSVAVVPLAVLSLLISPVLRVDMLALPIIECDVIAAVADWVQLLWDTRPALENSSAIGAERNDLYIYVVSVRRSNSCLWRDSQSQRQ